MADYEILKEGTVGSTTQDIDITGIPGTFKHLELNLVMASSFTSDIDDAINIRLNGDTTAGNYCIARVFSQSSSATVSQIERSGFGGGTQDRMWKVGYTPTRYSSGGTSSLFGYTRILFPAYSQTNFTKSCLTMSSVPAANDFPGSSVSGAGVMKGCFGWNSTAAITSIKLMSWRTGGFLTNSTYTIAGIS